VFTFGDGANGQLGHGNKLLEVSEPCVMKWNQPTKIVQVSCGEGHTALISGEDSCNMNTSVKRLNRQKQKIGKY